MPWARIVVESRGRLELTGLLGLSHLPAVLLCEFLADPSTVTIVPREDVTVAPRMSVSEAQGHFVSTSKSYSPLGWSKRDSLRRASSARAYERSTFM